MAQIFDVRGAGGELVVIGGALTLPTSSTVVAAPKNGSLRYNVTSGRPELYAAGTWTALAAGTVGQWSGGTVTVLDSSLSLSSGTLGIGTLTYAQLPTEVRSLPLSFVLPGKPPSSQTYNLVIAMTCTLPVGFSGAKMFNGTVATANAVFAVKQISGGTTTQIGTITMTAGSHTAGTLTAASAVTLAVGDVLQLVAPSSQDATLSDIGITLLATRT